MLTRFWESVQGLIKSWDCASDDGVETNLRPQASNKLFFSSPPRERTYDNSATYASHSLPPENSYGRYGGDVDTIQSLPNEKFIGYQENSENTVSSSPEESTSLIRTKLTLPCPIKNPRSSYRSSEWGKYGERYKKEDENEQTHSLTPPDGDDLQFEFHDGLRARCFKL